MRPQSKKMLTDARIRAFRQLDFSLRQLARMGNNGKTFKWTDSEGRKHQTLAHCVQSFYFRASESAGCTEYFSESAKRWLGVENMPITCLCVCADDLLHDVTYNKR